MIDLRSDTVTKPTAAMRAAMAAAEVGDDVYGEDPTIIALQNRVAAMFGHEAALFTPSGSMANQIAVQLLVPPAEELLCDANAHVVTYEMGAAAAIAGVSTRTWPFDDGRIDVSTVERMIRPDGFWAVPTRAIAIEQTHNLAGGVVIPLSELEELHALGLPLHCDGARIWHAHVATGTPFATYGRLFETLSVCLSKGLGAPVGSLVVGSAEKIEKARWIRKRMGGGMRQAGILAAAGLYALDHHIDRLADDHAKAKRVAEALGARWGGTNLVLIDVEDAPALVAKARAEGVLIGAMLPNLARLITHLDADDAAIDRAISVLKPILS